MKEIKRECQKCWHWHRYTKSKYGYCGMWHSKKFKADSCKDYRTTPQIS